MTSSVVTGEKLQKDVPGRTRLNVGGGTSLVVARTLATLSAKTRSPATAGTANRSLLFLEHRILMPELFTELRFSVLREFWTQEIRLPLLGGDAPRLG